jgi:hypothetical protein
MELILVVKLCIIFLLHFVWVQCYLFPTTVISSESIAVTQSFPLFVYLHDIVLGAKLCQNVENKKRRFCRNVPDFTEKICQFFLKNKIK